MRKLFICLVAVAFALTLTAPVMAADDVAVSFYGNVRMNTFWVSQDKLRTGHFDDDDLMWSFDTGNSRFGTNFKAGDITANVEIRPSNTSYFRQWWGAWDFGSGKFLLGQTWSPVFTSIFGCCFDGGPAGGYGGQNGSLRAPQVALWFPVGTGTLKIAALEPNSGSTNDIVAGSADTDVSLPKLEVSFDQKMGAFYFKLAGGYNSYAEVNTATDKEYDIDSWIVLAQPTYSFGPFTLKGLIWMARNNKQYAQVSSINPYNALYDAASDSIKDVDSMGYAATAGFKVSDTMSFEIGYSYTEDERDFDLKEADRDYIYIAMPLTLAKGVTVTPEIGVLDDGEQKTAGVATEQGDRTYFGAYWMISF